MARIWLIGGTQESGILAHGLVQAGLSVVVTVAQESARSLYLTHPSLEVWVGRLPAGEMDEFLVQVGAIAILDASHPFAVTVSKLAIATAQQRGIPYLRYERPEVATVSPPPSEPCGSASDEIVEKPPLEIILDSVEALINGSYLDGRRVLLTLGYQRLSLFQSMHSRATLFARILPSTVALEAALEADFTPDRLIALRPPISPELEQALWQQWAIATVVTKASGAAGGEATKRQVAQWLGVQLITIARPVVSYPQQTSDLDGAIAWCQNLSMRHPHA